MYSLPLYSVSVYVSVNCISSSRAVQHLRKSLVPVLAVTETRKLNFQRELDFSPLEHPLSPSHSHRLLLSLPRLRSGTEVIDPYCHRNPTSCVDCGCSRFDPNPKPMPLNSLRSMGPRCFSFISKLHWRDRKCSYALRTISQKFS